MIMGKSRLRPGFSFFVILRINDWNKLVIQQIRGKETMAEGFRLSRKTKKLILGICIGCMVVLAAGLFTYVYIKIYKLSGKKRCFYHSVLLYWGYKSKIYNFYILMDYER